MSARAGFTLLELLVALAAAGLLLLAARVTVEGVVDHTLRLLDDTRAADRDANATRTLRSVIGRLESGPGREFTGTRRAAQFATWCEVPAGWLERCTALLAFVDTERGRALVLDLSTGETLIIRRDVPGGELRYLDALGSRSWITGWGAGISAPVAFGIVEPGDTTILATGVPR
jgi:prepilin-type N-terminal cleavage/methylation domain-containing protein